MKNERGLGLLTVLVFGTIVAIAGYIAYCVVPFYYYFYELRNQFEQVIKVASVDTDEEIRKKLMYHIRKYQIPCDDEDLLIERSDDTMRISLRYKEVFYITWKGKDYDLKTFDFDATVEGRYK